MKVIKGTFYRNILIAATLLVLANCNQRTTQNFNVKQDTVRIENKDVGENEERSPSMLFKEYCTSCHGSGVNAFVDRKWMHGSSKGEISKSIRDGIINEGMPAYDTTFTTIELDRLTSYIMEGIADRESYTPNKIATPKYYTTQHLNLQIDTMVSDLGIPWGIEVSSNGTIYFTEKAGTIKIRKPNGVISVMENIPETLEFGQGGMLDIKLHPAFRTNSRIYVSYSKRNPEDNKEFTTAVARGVLVNDTLTQLEDVFVALPYVPTRYHFGSRMVFDDDGYLYVTVGDRGKREEHPQSLSNACGKVHRLHDDGRIPTDNPFYSVSDAVPSIWTYGHRNQQGIVFDASKDLLISHEHGPRGGDEMNIEQAGNNYGWPVISYGINYNGTTFTTLTEQEGMLLPINTWTPSIAPCGMAIVLGQNYGPWAGSILSGSLRFHYISRVTMDKGKVVEEERILKDIGRVRDIEMGADGFLYVGIENPGRILKLTVVSKKLDGM